jgi:hypothetical protein
MTQKTFVQSEIIKLEPIVSLIYTCVQWVSETFTVHLLSIPGKRVKDVEKGDKDMLLLRGEKANKGNEYTEYNV